MNQTLNPSRRSSAFARGPPGTATARTRRSPLEEVADGVGGRDQRPQFPPPEPPHPLPSSPFHLRRNWACKSKPELQAICTGSKDHATLDSVISDRPRDSDAFQFQEIDR
jgi:hypothetical protein